MMRLCCVRTCQEVKKKLFFLSPCCRHSYRRQPEEEQLGASPLADLRELRRASTRTRLRWSLTREELERRRSTIVGDRQER